MLYFWRIISCVVTYLLPSYFLELVTSDCYRICSCSKVRKKVGITCINKSVMSTSRLLELLHSNLFIPTSYTSIVGNKYGFVIVDDFSRYAGIFYHNDKKGVFNIFKLSVKRSQNEFVLKIIKVRSKIIN